MIRGGGIIPLGTLYVRLAVDPVAFVSGMLEAERGMTSSVDAMLRQARLLSIGVTAAFAAVGAAAVAEFAKFNKAMTESTAIMGDLSRRTRQDMEDLALTLSTEGVKSAEELAKSYYYLASAGLSANQTMVAMPVAMKFATAGAFEMEKATQLLVSAQAALGLKTEDTTQFMKNMVRISDVLVKADIIAQGSVEQFAEALTNKAAAALRMANKDVEEGVAVLAAFADQGLRGEAAGEALNIVLRDLQRTAITNRKAFQDLGVEVYDSAGNMRNMADILKDFEKLMGGASVELRRTAFQMLGFHDRSLSALLTLIGFSDKVREFEASLRKAGGTTEDVTKRQLEAFTNQWVITLHQLQAFLILLGGSLAPALKELNENIRDVIKWLQDVQKESGAITAILMTMIDIIKYLVFGLGALITVLKSLGIVLNVLVNRDLAQLEVAIVTMVKLFKIWWDSIDSIEKGLFALAGVAKGAGDVLDALSNRDFGKAAGAFLKMQVERANAVRNAIKTIKDGVKDSLDVIDESEKKLGDIHKKFVKESQEGVFELLGVWGGFLKFAIALFPSLDPGLQNAKKSVDNITNSTNALADSLKKVADNADEGAKKIIMMDQSQRVQELMKLLGKPPSSELFTRREAAFMKDVSADELINQMKRGQQGELSSEDTANMLRAHGIIGQGAGQGAGIGTENLYGNALIGQENAVAREIAINQNKLRILEELNKRDVNMTKEAQKEKAEAIENYNKRIYQLHLAQASMVVTAGQQMFDALGKAVEGFAGRQSKAYKAMFAASKAMAIATSAVKIAQAMAAALGDVPWPGNLIAIATVVAEAATIVSTIQATRLELSGGEKAMGGPVYTGKTYLVGEKGPEVFSPASNGTIVPNDKLGGSTRVVINNYTDVRPEVRERTEGNERVVEVILRRVKGELSSEIRDGRGDLSRSMESSYGLKRGR